MNMEGYDLIKTEEWEIWGYRSCEYLGTVSTPTGFEYSREHDFNKSIRKEKGFKIGRYFGDKQQVKVPAYIEGKKILGIGSVAFNDIINEHAEPCATLRSIEIAEGVKFLDEGMFEGFSNLSNIKLPDSLVYIGGRCFARTAAKCIVFPKEAIYVSISCFCGCVNLESITLQEGLEYIGDDSFAGCIALKTIAIPSTVKRICSYAFSDSGLQCVAIPEGVSQIKKQAFGNCRDLRSCVIPRSVCEIDDSAFSWYDEVINYKELYYNNPNLTLYVYPGSYALMWAREHGYKVASAVL